MPCGSFPRKAPAARIIVCLSSGMEGSEEASHQHQADRPRSLIATIDALTSPKRRIEASPGTNGISKGSTFK